MNILRSYKISAAALLMCTATVSFAQTGSADPTVPNPGGGVSRDWQPSLTNDGAFERIKQKDRVALPIPWQPIRETDILWKKRVWREIDTREKQNVGFRYAGDEHTGGGMFIEILIDGIKTGKITAYSAMDDRFTTIMSKAELMEKIAARADTIMVLNPITEIEEPRIKLTDFRPETITKYRIKEDWIFDRNIGQMVVRIVGIAPVQDIYGDDGSYRGAQAMFWLYYPDIRNQLARYEVFNPQNDLARATWDEFFEGRRFSSRIYKVSNPFGNIVGGYGEEFKEHLSPMESLYESKKVSEEIFNKEVDMWVY
ncbi:MAG: gliding motility protein GldN [Bacteroidota bacterium]